MRREYFEKSKHNIQELISYLNLANQKMREISDDTASLAGVSDTAQEIEHGILESICSAQNLAEKILPDNLRNRKITYA